MKKKHTTALAVRLSQRPGGVTVNQLAAAAGVSASAARRTLNVLYQVGEMTREPGTVPAIQAPGGRPWIYFFRWNGDIPGGAVGDGR